MTVQELLRLALVKLGNTHPTPVQYSNALQTLNFTLDTITYWDDSVLPVLEYTSMNTVVNLPYKYVEALIWMVAAKEAVSYGVEPSAILAIANTYQSRLDYPNGQALVIGSVPTEVI